VIPVKAAQKEQIPGIIHDTSSTGATFYIEPHSIVDQGNQLRQYRRLEQIEEEKILRQLSNTIAEAFEDLEYLLAIATRLDLATARARYSLWLEGNPPHFIDGSETITLRNLRHPLLWWQKHHEQGGEVIPINVQISPEIRVVAITGPNTGGKTVTLKTLGLAALMAKRACLFHRGNRWRYLGSIRFWPISGMNSLCNRVYQLFRVTFAGLFAF